MQSSSPATPIPQPQRTYLGLFDDKLAQYDLGQASRRDNLLKGLVRDALFGGEGYLNDGYFMMNPLCQEAILGDRSHPLRALLELGQVRLLSNSDDIERSLVKRQESQVRDFGEFMKTDRWKAMKKKLPRLSRTLHDRGLISPWPQGLDLGSGFVALIARYAAHTVEARDLGLQRVTTDQLRRVCDAFFRRMGSETFAARTRWEAVCAEELQLVLGSKRCTRSLAMRELMSIGNAAYHFNFALALGASAGGSAAVETINTDCFDELLDVPAPDLSRLGAPRGLSVPAMPSLMNGHALDSFLMKHADDKQRFLADYEDYLNHRIDRGYLDGSAEIYREHIASHFGRHAKWEDTTGFQGVWTLVFFAGNAALDAAVPGISIPVKAAGAAIGFMTDKFALPHVMRKLAVKQLQTQASGRNKREHTALAGQFKRAQTLMSVLDHSKVQEMKSIYKPFAG